MENPEKINWVCLSRNTHPNAIKLLRANPEKNKLHQFIR
jgi:hypothetical protein